MSLSAIAVMTDLVYLLSASLFVIGLKLLSSPKTARRGNFIAAFGMLLAILVTLLDRKILSFEMIFFGMLLGSILGALLAEKIRMTAMPQMVAMLNGFGGLASALVSWSEYNRLVPAVEPGRMITIFLGTLVGAVTFSGSMIAFAKLEDLVKQQPIIYPLQQPLNLLLAFILIGLGAWIVVQPAVVPAYWGIFILSLGLGILIVLPIGGADMPVIISLLNSLSGIAGAITGFILMNKILIVSGAIVGSSGIILSEIMCKAMNRSLTNVLFGAFGKIPEAAAGAKGAQDYASVKSASPEEASMILDSADSVIIVPGYGLAASRAQHSLKVLADLLQSRGKSVKYAIHPVAGRMPGHMNVLLAEADVPYDQLYEMDAINPEFDRTDAVIVVGANDVTNPAARNQPGSPIYGMPILNVDKARSVMVIKRSLSPGFAGIKNPLFELDKTVMLYGDAKEMLERLAKEMKAL
jgi:NAD(P) transhydrogenase subunit beta